MLNIVVQTAAVTVQVGLSGFHEVFTASRIKLLDKNTNIFFPSNYSPSFSFAHEV